MIRFATLKIHTTPSPMGSAIPWKTNANIAPSRHHIKRMSQPAATPRVTSTRDG